jgi:RimJ/RimL family protein N-acetyltransferase
MSELPCFAVPFNPYPEKLTQILDGLCQHRPWFPDELWNDPLVRRQAASRRLAEWMTDGVVWEAWRGDMLVGILGIDRVVPRHEAYCHFVFLDRKLSDKVDLCMSLMGWCFKALDLHILRVEIPTYARVLARFARKRLGFRYDAEAPRQLSWPPGPGLSPKEAELGSRKFHGQRYEGSWHDLLLLSLTKEEFNARPISQAGRCLDGPDSGTRVTDLQLPGGGASGPEGGSGDTQSPSPALGPPATGGEQL